MASQLTDLSSEAELGNCRNSWTDWTRKEESRVAPCVNEFQCVGTVARLCTRDRVGQAHSLRLPGQVSARSGGEWGLLLVHLDPCFEEYPTLRWQHKAQRRELGRSG